jgi:hypothetical protein
VDVKILCELADKYVHAVDSHPHRSELCPCKSHISKPTVYVGERCQVSDNQSHSLEISYYADLNWTPLQIHAYFLITCAPIQLNPL